MTATQLLDKEVGKVAGIKTLNGYQLADTEAREKIAALEADVEDIKNGAVSQPEEETLEFAGYAKLPTDGTWITDGAVEMVTSPDVISTRARSTISGGRVYVDWDTSKVNGFIISASLYSPEGALEKRFVGSNGTLNPYYNKVEGDLGADAWMEHTGTKADFIQVSAPFSLPIPAGYTVEVFPRMANGNLTFPDGTLTVATSYAWASTGVTVTVKGAETDADAGYTLSTAQKAACKAYASMFAETAGDADAFVYFTDPHLCGDTDVGNLFWSYLNTLAAVYHSVPASRCICGGDWLVWNNTKDNAAWLLGVIDGAMRDRFGGAYTLIVGNHDTNYQGYEYVQSGEDGTYDRTQSALCELSTVAVRNLWSRGQGASYYKLQIDTAAYYVFDTWIDWDAAIDEYKQAQIDWYAKSLFEDRPERSAVLMHIVDSAGAATPMVNAVTQIAAAYNARTSVSVNGKTYDYTDATGHVGYVMGGHKHEDLVYTANGIPVIVTTTLKAADGYPSFDLVLADWAEKKVKMVRVGLGDDRTVEMAALEEGQDD